MTEQFLTPKEVSKRLGISQRTVLEWMRAGKLPAFKIGGTRWRMTESALIRWMSEGMELGCDL